MTRLEANKEILRVLHILARNHPDQRFIQLLFNANVLKVTADGGLIVCNEYHLESEELLKRVKQGDLWQRLMRRE